MTSSQKNSQNKNSIPRTRATWQTQLTNAFKDPLKLLEYLHINPKQLPYEIAQTNFPMLVPQHFAQLMTQQDVNDPLLRQVLPIHLENNQQVGFSLDPLAESEATKVNGILHKYHGRALFFPTSACAVNCRYCFRRHYDYQQEKASGQRWQAGLNYLQQHTDIEEVILSGGDPLAINDKLFSQLIDALSQISHLKRLRIHTRLPIVLPNRITQTLINTLQHSRFSTVMVLHCNHANELSTPLHTAIQLLKRANITLLNQSVLLKEVNDNVNTLQNLHNKLFEFGILPYYLHLLDPVMGVGHFNVSQSTALQLIQQLQAISPGYLIPKLAKEEAHHTSKTILTMETSVHGKL